jgi:hypothetical protein
VIPRLRSSSGRRSGRLTSFVRAARPALSESGQLRWFGLSFSNLRKSCGAAASATSERSVPFSSTRLNTFWQRNSMHLWTRQHQSHVPVLSQSLSCRCHGIIWKSSSTSSVRPVTLWQRYQIPSLGFGNMVLLAHTNAPETIRIAYSGSHVWLAGLTLRSSGPNRHWQNASSQRSDFSSPSSARSPVGSLNFFR